MYKCKGRIDAGYEVATIPDEKYWDIYHKVWEHWNELTSMARTTGISVADIIADKYNTCYAVGADIANSISLSKTIG